MFVVLFRKKKRKEKEKKRKKTCIEEITKLFDQSLFTSANYTLTSGVFCGVLRIDLCVAKKEGNVLPCFFKCPFFFLATCTSACAFEFFFFFDFPHLENVYSKIGCLRRDYSVNQQQQQKRKEEKRTTELLIESWRFSFLLLYNGSSSHPSFSPFSDSPSFFLFKRLRLKSKAMSKVARAKKMFDDVSSDEDSKESDAAGLSPVVPAQSVDPHITGAETVPVNKAESIITSEYAEGDSHAFVPKSVSASQARAEQEAGNAKENADAAPAAAAAASEEGKGELVGMTMVTRVEVSPPPKEAASASKRATTRKQKAPSATTPAKSAAAGAAGSSTYSTPATVSKRPVEREEREAADRTHDLRSVRKDTGAPAAAASASASHRNHKSPRRGESASKSSHYKERRNEDDVVFRVVANPSESHVRRAQREEDEEMMLRSPYSTTSGRKASPAQLDYSHEEPRPSQAAHADHAELLGQQTSDEESEVEDFPFSTYVFPRLDPALADYQGSRTAVGAAKRGEEFPPNACERTLAYLMVTDIRLAVYIGVLFLSIVFVIVSIPTSQLDLVGKSCITYWGYKDNCDTATYTYTRPLYECEATRSRLGAGAAFSIITLVVYVVNFTAAIIVVCCLKESPHKVSLTSRVVVGSLGVVTIVMQLISWAVIASIHSSHYCLDKGVLAFGVGFGLNLASWVLNVLGVVLLLAVPLQLVDCRQRS